jgi:DNA-binding MarR family transcriptional regulator
VNGLPEDVHRFLARHINSVEELEVLLHARQSPGRSWSPTDMARELYSHPTSIEQRFQRLLGAGLLRESAAGHFQYAPRSAELDQVVARLADTYRERRVAVVSLIASKPIENVRAFSDAFRLRKRKEE